MTQVTITVTLNEGDSVQVHNTGDRISIDVAHWTPETGNLLRAQRSIPITDDATAEIAKLQRTLVLR